MLVDALLQKLQPAQLGVVVESAKHVFARNAGILHHIHGKDKSGQRRFGRIRVAVHPQIDASVQTNVAQLLVHAIALALPLVREKREEEKKEPATLK